MFSFEKIDLENILVIAALSISLIMSILYGLGKLALSIVTGLLGYILYGVIYEGGTVTKGENGNNGKTNNNSRA